MAAKKLGGKKLTQAVKLAAVRTLRKK